MTKRSPAKLKRLAEELEDEIRLLRLFLVGNHEYYMRILGNLQKQVEELGKGEEG